MDGGPFLVIREMEQTSFPSGFNLEQTVVYELGSIKAELRSLNENLSKREIAHNNKIEKLENDVSRLKHNEALRMGAAAAISFVIGILVKVIQWPSLNL